MLVPFAIYATGLIFSEFSSSNAHYGLIIARSFLGGATRRDPLMEKYSQAKAEGMTAQRLVSHSEVECDEKPSEVLLCTSYAAGAAVVERRKSLTEQVGEIVPNADAEEV